MGNLSEHLWASRLSEARSKEREHLLNAIRRESAANPEETLARLKGLELSIPGQAQEYSDFIEAHWFGSERWSVPLVEEFDRIYRLCTTGPSWGRLFAFGSFAYLEHFANNSLKFALAQRYIAALDSPHPAVRHSVIFNHTGVNTGASQTAFHAAVRRLLADPDWKVRAIADNYLRGEHALRATYRPSIIDRVRRRYFTWIVYWVR